MIKVNLKSNSDRTRLISHLKLLMYVLLFYTDHERQTDLMQHQQQQRGEPQTAEITANFTFQHFDPVSDPHADHAPP